ILGVCPANPVDPQRRRTTATNPVARSIRASHRGRVWWFARLLPPVLFLLSFAALTGLTFGLAAAGVSDSVATPLLGSITVVLLGWAIFIFGARGTKHQSRPPLRPSDGPTLGQILATVALVYGSLAISAGRSG